MMCSKFDNTRKYKFTLPHSHNINNVNNEGGNVNNNTGGLIIGVATG